MRIVLMALALAGGAAAATTTWGGPHVEMIVTDRGARLEFDCAHGTIDEPLRIDSDGAFRVKGTFAPERSGPSRDGREPRPAEAIYSGTVKDDTMTMRIVVDGQDRENTYALARDRPGTVRKCR